MKDINMKDLLKVILVLSVIALIAGLLLGAVNLLTSIDEQEALVNTVKTEFSDYNDIKLLETGEGIGLNRNYEYGKVGNCFTANSANGDNVLIINAEGYGGYGGNIGLLIAIEGNIIKKVVVASSSETPGLGSKALTNEYLAQYVGSDIGQFDTYKLAKSSSGKVIKYLSPATNSSDGVLKTSENGEISAVTGATKSSTAVLGAFNSAAEFYKKYTEVER